ncbi:MAG: hypothetical protein KGV51_00980 [Moraxellaceae bacterium]|nr:hypothetical protein [Moraxellaceae bacterium]
MSVVKSRVNGLIINANEHTTEVIKLGGGKYAELADNTTSKKAPIKKTTTKRTSTKKTETAKSEEVETL